MKKKMKVLHLLALGGAGGIESLCSDTAKYSKDENHFYFLWGGGKNAEIISELTENITVRKFQNKNFFVEIKYFWNYCSVNKIECIICQGVSPMMLLFCYLTKIFHPKIKLVLYAHANAEDLFYRKTKRILFKFAYRRADGCIAISQSVMKSLKRYVKKTQKIHTIYNGVDVSKFSGAFNEKTEFSRRLRLIYVGRLIPEKGVNLLVEAMAYLENRIDFELDIIGNGIEYDRLTTLCSEKGLDTKVHFRGEKYNISEWLKKSDLFIHPAIWNEGFGITLIESMAAGVPCVAFNKGAIPEIISNEIDGFIVEDTSAEKLSQKIEYIFEIIQDKERWNSIQKNAIKKANTFDINIYVTKLSEYINNL